MDQLTPLGAAVAGRSAETVEDLLDRHVPKVPQNDEGKCTLNNTVGSKPRYTPLLAINLGRWGMDVDTEAPLNVSTLKFLVSTSKSSNGNAEKGHPIWSQLLQALGRFCKQEGSHPVPNRMLDSFYAHSPLQPTRETASGLIDTISRETSQLRKFCFMKRIDCLSDTNITTFCTRLRLIKCGTSRNCKLD